MITTKRLFRTKDFRGTHMSGPGTQKEVFNRVVEFFKKHECFSGECVHQSDGVQLDAVNLFSDLLDDVLKFEVNFGDDE